MKKIIILILAVFISLIVFIVFLFNANKQDEKVIQIIENEKKENIPPIITEEIGYKELYTIVGCINNYYEFVDTSNSAYYGRDKDGKLVRMYEDDEIKEKVKNLISDDAKTDIDLYDSKYTFIPIDAIKLISGNVDSYALYGILADDNMRYEKDLYYVVNLDNKNSTYSINQLNNEYEDLKDIKVKELKSIKSNNSNKFKYSNLSEELKSLNYFNYIKGLILTKPKIAYTYLDENYQKERFNTYEDFEEYIKRNRDMILKNEMKGFEVNNEGTQIIVKDSFSNYFKFKISGVMNYKVQLDNYIVMFDEEIEKYNQLSNTKKCIYSLKRWINMINSKDYEIAYKYLDETYRTKTFGSLNKFEKYVKNNWPEYIKATIEKYEEMGQYGTVNLKIFDRDKEDEEIVSNNTFIIKLLDSPEFVLSFDTNE